MPNILCSTKDMTRDEWLAARAHGSNGDIPITLGGSDVAAVFGLSPWVAPEELYAIKSGKTVQPRKNNDWQMEFGSLMEAVVARMYSHKTGAAVIEDYNLYQHSALPWALANIDRRVEYPDGRKGLLEIKTANYENRFQWLNGRIPVQYELQVRYYMAVLDEQMITVVCVWGNSPRDMAEITLARDLSLEEQLLGGCIEFVSAVERGTPPPYSCKNPAMLLDAMTRIYHKEDENHRIINFKADIGKRLIEIVTLDESIKSFENQRDAIKAQLIPVMGEAKRGSYFDSASGKKYTVTFSSRANSNKRTVNVRVKE